MEPIIDSTKGCNIEKYNKNEIIPAVYKPPLNLFFNNVESQICNNDTIIKMMHNIIIVASNCIKSEIEEFFDITKLIPIPKGIHVKVSFIHTVNDLFNNIFIYFLHKI